MAIGLALSMAAPLAAQDNAAPAAPVSEPAPGTITLVSVSESVRSGPSARALLNHDERLCLQDGEEAVFASERVTFLLVGEGCFAVAQSESTAFEQERRALAQQTLEEARLAFSEAEQSGDPAAKEAAFARYAEAARNAPDEEWVDEIERARAAAVAARDLEERARMAPPSASPPSRTRVRTGAARGDQPTPPRPIVFRLAAASPSVLKRFPRGSLVQRTTALCLAAGEEATIVASNGQSASYVGPGCMRRDARPTPTNIGGFTFG